MLTLNDLKTKYGINKTQAYKMAKVLHLKKGRNGKWLFPDDFVPVFIPDGRKYKTLADSAALPYVYLMDVISKLWLAEDNYMAIDEQIRKTVVRELKANHLIILKEGAESDSLDYRDYMVAVPDEWHNMKVSAKKSFILDIINVACSGASYGAVSALR